MKSRDSLIRLKRFQADEKRRQVSQIEMMIAEFERMAKDLDEQIAIEQERSGIRDVNHFAYPTFAKAAMQRRDNLRASAGELQGQLEQAQDELHAALDELKKYEQMAERDRAGQAEGEEQAADATAPRSRSQLAGERRW
ncbi:MAG: flagellar export protein FliJ [Rhizobiales bacterium]|nr:flagellar export protein FliJ [Hyphomicrobiales bacterium]